MLYYESVAMAASKAPGQATISLSEGFGGLADG